MKKLMDVKGQIIRQYQTTDAMFMMEKETLEAGIYFLHILGDKKWGMVKLVVL